MSENVTAINTEELDVPAGRRKKRLNNTNIALLTRLQGFRTQTVSAGTVHLPDSEVQEIQECGCVYCVFDCSFYPSSAYWKYISLFRTTQKAKDSHEMIVTGNKNSDRYLCCFLVFFILYFVAFLNHMKFLRLYHCS